MRMKTVRADAKRVRATTAKRTKLNYGSGSDQQRLIHVVSTADHFNTVTVELTLRAVLGRWTFEQRFFRELLQRY
jgi:hypothetical protein